MSAKQWAESIMLQFPLRVALGGVFVFAAFTKISNVQAFAFAIKGFKVLDPDKHGHLIISAAYTMPWVEMIAGVLLILGLKTKAATLTIGLMLVFFIGALLHVIFDPSIDADCSCFGDMNLVCGASVGWCQVVRDLVMLIPVGYLLWRGGGNLALDTLIDKKETPSGPIEGTYSAPKVDEDGIRG
ncbi:MAG: DoxX family membrane protein [Phycisphaerales bacterium]|nr:DoxX family membrane protein [Phycisphaerales bacterium]